jgi:sec-independent protein translocase protein TatC
MLLKQKTLAKQAKNHRSDAAQPASSTFSDHIRELRHRVLWIALAFLITSAVAYNYHDQLVQIVMAPLQGEKLVYLTPGGGFNFIFQITLYAGFIAAAPMLMYQLYGFIRPTLPLHAKRKAVSVAGFAILLMLIGVAYGYFVAIPSALTFLSTFAGTEIIPNLTADSYLNFFLAYTGGLALLFQLPLFLIFWHWINPMKPGGLLKSERFVIVFAFLAAALITPTPDVVNQAMIAVPLIAIYQIGVATVLVSIWRHNKKQASVQASQTAPLPAVVTSQTVTQTITPPPVIVHTSTTPSSQSPRAVQRSIDGFSNRPVRQLASAPRRPQPLQTVAPLRPLQRTQPLLQPRSRSRIDDILPRHRSKPLYIQGQQAA